WNVAKCSEGVVLRPGGRQTPPFLSDTWGCSCCNPLRPSALVQDHTSNNSYMRHELFLSKGVMKVKRSNGEKFQVDSSCVAQVGQERLCPGDLPSGAAVSPHHYA
ncbi:mCG1036764, partial [Mus musculus]